ncbi:MAG: class E sortase [Thermoleophilaceae bacterium]|nr:class E sortase [Thermoleophilaceae bacterium]
MRRTAAALLFVLGVLAVTESAITFAWQEPLTAVLAGRRQAELERQLEARVAAPVPSRRSPAELAARLERSTEAGDALGRIAVPRLGLSYVFVEGSGSGSLAEGPGHYESTPLPGEHGTVGIAGHRTTHLAPFRRLDELHRGDAIVLAMPYGRFTYRVTGTEIVRPSSVSVLRRRARDGLVLTTCHPLFSAAERLVVFAREHRQQPRFDRRPKSATTVMPRPPYGEP